MHSSLQHMLYQPLHGRFVHMAVAADRGGQCDEHAAQLFEIDDVIDPAVTRARFVHALESAGPAEHWSTGRRPARPFVDTW